MGHSASDLAVRHWNQTPLYLPEEERYRLYPWLPEAAEFRHHRGERVLEIGCGTGCDLLQFAKHGATATGIDITPAHLELAHQRVGNRATLVEADARSLPFPNASFDYVYSHRVLHHSDEPRRIVQELFRVLRLGGRFNVHVYALFSHFAFWKMLHHVRDWKLWLEKSSGPVAVHIDMNTGRSLRRLFSPAHLTLTKHECELWEGMAPPARLVPGCQGTSGRETQVMSTNPIDIRNETPCEEAALAKPGGHRGTPTVGTIDSHPASLLRDWRRAISSDFFRKVAETYATRMFLIGIGLVLSVVVARVLGPSGRGLYAVAGVTGALGVQFGNLGLHAANVYFVARKPNSLATLLGNSLAVSFGFGGLISIILAITFVVFPTLIAIHGVVLLLALLSIPFGLAYLLMQNLVLGVHDVHAYNLLETINRVLSLVFIASLILLGCGGVTNFIAAGLAALTLSCLEAWRRLRIHCRNQIAVSLSLFRGSICYALKAYWACLFSFLLLRADLFMVQRMLGVEQAGYYSVASSMADYVSIVASVIGTILFPRLSAMSEMRAKLHLTRKAAWGTAALLLPLLGLAALLARPAVRVLFGAAFVPAAHAFALLMPGMLFLGINSVAVQFLNSIGYPKIVVVVWGLCLVFNISADLWAIPRYGILGASVVSSLSYFLAFFFILRVIRHTALLVREEVLP